MLLERLSALEAGLGIRTSNEDTDGELSARKEVNNGIDYQAPVIDKFHENNKKPIKKKRK